MSKTKMMLSFYLSDPAVLVHILLAVGATWLAISVGDWGMLAAFVFGWMSYVVQEHLVHRYIFHAPAPRKQVWFNMLYRLHYGHHDQIHNVHLLFTPLWFSAILGLVNVAVISQVIPLSYTIVFVYGGGVCSYLLFEWLHLLSHFNTQDRGSIALWITRRHAQHHFIDYNNWFTVSPGGNLVDSLLGADPAERSRVEHARTCGLDPNDPRLVAARAHFRADRTLATAGI